MSSALKKMKTFIFALTLSVGVNSLLLPINNTALLSEDGRLSFSELADKYGFPDKKIHITTKDGYILILHHLIGGKGVPILLAPGNTASASCYIIRGKNSLAITLARLGYDVWVINFRGTSESRKHVHLSPDKDSKLFFDYSFYEQGVFDLPPVIDYILEHTGYKKLIAIGHSVGTTSLYTLCSEKTEYNEKIAIVISLAPICYLNHVRGISIGGISFGNILSALASFAGVSELANHQQFASSFLQTLCLGPLGYEICVKGFIFNVFGPDEQGFEREFVNTFFGHYPESSSTKMFEHLLQISQRKQFAKYNYGFLRNMIEYKSPVPPVFDLSKVTVDVATFTGKQDYLATVEDVERLSSELPRLVHKETMAYDNFNHFNFVWGRYMHVQLYPSLLPLIKKYADLYNKDKSGH